VLIVHVEDHLAVPADLQAIVPAIDWTVGFKGPHVILLPQS
jgi:hypothetical protein